MCLGMSFTIVNLYEACEICVELCLYHVDMQLSLSCLCKWLTAIVLWKIICLQLLQFCLWALFFPLSQGLHYCYAKFEIKWCPPLTFLAAY